MMTSTTIQKSHTSTPNQRLKLFAQSMGRFPKGRRTTFEELGVLNAVTPLLRISADLQQMSSLIEPGWFMATNTTIRKSHTLHPTGKLKLFVGSMDHFGSQPSITLKGTKPAVLAAQSLGLIKPSQAFFTTLPY
jgi:hypothetical protein